MNFLTALYKIKNPAKALTVAYVFAFAVIAVFTLAGHFTTYHIMKMQAESTDMTYQLSRIRGLTQKVPYHVANFGEHGTEIDQLILSQSLNEVESSHLFLISKIMGKDTISERLKDIYYSSRFELHSNVIRFLAIARKCVEEDIVHGDPKKICEITVDLLSAGLSSDLSSGFDVALEGYRTETVQKIKKHHLIQVYGTIVILLVLLLEAILIFRPLIARIKIYHRLLLKQALEDPLTKLKNRRAFSKSAESELRQSQRNKTPVSIALMDLDKFKLVNDTYGHDVGDTVLKHFSSMLKKHLRGGDIIGRVGGEEFAVVLVRSTDGPEAFKVLDRMRELVANTPCPYTDKSGKLCYLNYSVSIGVVALVPDDQKIEELLVISDEMLYKAKDTGRNKVVLAD
jgi:diguanylate cyclase (GGDEF)-like protein